MRLFCFSKSQVNYAKLVILTLIIIDHVNFLFGLPEADAKEVCKMFYRENVAKVIVEIVGPDVMRLEKDINTTFTQKLGIIGMVSTTDT